MFYAVEDNLSRAVLERICISYGVAALLRELGGRQGGFGHIKKNLRKYAELAKIQSVVIFTDQDQFICPPALRSVWLNSANLNEPLPDRMAFCIATREIEAWLIADRTNLANFLEVSATHIPVDPEQVLDPKEALINAARKSRNRDRRLGIPPTPGSGSKVGIAYNEQLMRFVAEAWDPQVAAAVSPSLLRAVARITGLNGN